LKYWCHVHRRVLAVGEQMADRFLFVRFEDLCRTPETEIPRLACVSSSYRRASRIELVGPGRMVGTEPVVEELLHSRDRGFFTQANATMVGPS
jgi:hypothetical protein